MLLGSPSECNQNRFTDLPTKTPVDIFVHYSPGLQVEGHAQTLADISNPPATTFLGGLIARTQTLQNPNKKESGEIAIVCKPWSQALLEPNYQQDASRSS